MEDLTEVNQPEVQILQSRLYDVSSPTLCIQCVAYLVGLVQGIASCHCVWYNFGCTAV